jgi:LysR family hydrogen peroxide-inducible transcriptional activator
MNLRSLNYLTSLEKYGSFKRAAEECHVSQPALSIQIKKLEEELGVVLLERSSKGFLFTDCGREVLKHAYTVLQLIEEIEQLAGAWDNPYAGTLSLGAFPTLGPYFLPQILDHLVDAYPQLQINLVEEKTHILIERLLQGQLDAAFLALPVEEDALEFGEIFSEEFYVGVSSQHVWSQKNTIHAQELASERLLLLEDGHCLRGQALDYCSSSGIGEVLNFRASSMETLLQMISMGRAVSLIPECVARRNPALHFLSLEGGGPKRTIALFWRKTSVRKDLMMELVDDLSREYGAL